MYRGFFLYFTTLRLCLYPWWIKTLTRKYWTFQPCDLSEEYLSTCIYVFLNFFPLHVSYSIWPSKNQSQGLEFAATKKKHLFFFFLIEGNLTRMAFSKKSNEMFVCVCVCVDGNLGIIMSARSDAKSMLLALNANHRSNLFIWPLQRSSTFACVCQLKRNLGRRNLCLCFNTCQAHLWLICYSYLRSEIVTVTDVIFFFLKPSWFMIIVKFSSNIWTQIFSSIFELATDNFWKI